MTAATLAAAALVGVSVVAAGDAAMVARSRLRRRSAGGSLLRSTAAGRPVPASGVVSGSLVALIGLPLAVRLLGAGPALSGLLVVLCLVARRPLADRSAARRRERDIAAALPRFADLLAACLESGAPPGDALDVVRRHLGGPLAVRLAPVVGALRSGVDPLTLYDNQGGGGDPVRGLVTALARAAESGAPLADTVATVADEQRRRRRWSAEAAARRAGVYAVGPLVVCFLPAFVLLGVVPVVLGVAAQVLGDLS